ncbi:MAG TPA: DUF4160 domain-containing protein [Rhodothermales bacterium]|nr:DUF4160 domain-containing protein [Rhodothermales bacterium]
MPRISEFFGIAIYIYYHDAQRHHGPHIHARYSEHKASFSIATGEPLGGQLPPRQERLVRRWIEKRRAELEANWQRALRDEELNWIEP